ncbi:hypothetical protein DSUL_100038 [Desulfovibrionales bacterium]
MEVAIVEEEEELENEDIPAIKDLFAFGSLLVIYNSCF